MPHSHNTSPPVTAPEGQVVYDDSVAEDSIETALDSLRNVVATNRAPSSEDTPGTENPGHETTEDLGIPGDVLPNDRHSEDQEVSPAALQEFEDFFRNGFDYVKRLAAQRGASDPEAVAMEAFLSVFRTLHTYTPNTNMKAWVFRAVIHRTIDERRRSQNRLEAPESAIVEDLEGYTPSSPSAESEVLDAHAAEGFETLLQILPEDQRDVVRGSICQRYTTKDIRRRQRHQSQDRTHSAPSWSQQAQESRRY